MSKLSFNETRNVFIDIIQNNYRNSFENMIDNMINGYADINVFSNDDNPESLVYLLTSYHRTEMLEFLFSKQIVIPQSQLIKSLANQARVMNCYPMLGVDEHINKSTKTIDLLATQIKNINSKFFLNDQVGEITILQYMVLLQSTDAYYRGFNYVFDKLADRLSIEHIANSMEINIQESLIERSTRFHEFTNTIDYLLQKLSEHLSNNSEKNIEINQSIILRALSQSTHDNSELIKLLTEKSSINWNDQLDHCNDKGDKVINQYMISEYDSGELFNNPFIDHTETNNFDELAAIIVDSNSTNMSDDVQSLGDNF